MGGKAPRLIITDEDASMKSAIRTILPDTVHRFCMWHIMEKFSEKVGPPINHDKEFWAALNNCVWGSETREEFEMRWNSLIIAYGLERNEWLSNRYQIRESWIPAFFMEISLAGVLRTTSREILYDDEGNVLDEKPKDPIEVEKRKKIAMVRNKVEDAIQKAKSSNDAMNFLLSSVLNIDASLGNMILRAVPQRQDEYENFVGCEIPEEIQIHPPNDV
ncbi:protein FAR-RED IMPAIRED RESPONSE 1-like [Panicum hallii]|uniref:protein FAR-RED IMPAIRED RESPONSE 1-like n=1 Tax=Panicum hallii TaxID=206008 RepID=UPI000DF4D4CB|nr:protein FAR-RED IMPAIRED RESPONSE 1-like [Panicum hallii]